MNAPAINRVYLLLGIFNVADVPLEKVVTLYFPHISEREWKRRASLQQMPFPIFRSEKSQKAPWLVNVNDLAAYLDRQASEAAKDWSAENAPHIPRGGPGIAHEPKAYLVAWKGGTKSNLLYAGADLEKMRRGLEAFTPPEDLADLTITPLYPPKEQPQ